MHPELFRIPGFDLTVKSYGLMMVIGFICAVYIIRRLSRDITPDPRLITNAALYSLIAGIVGARIFYVVHHFDEFQDGFLSFFAVWKGGLELIGGVILAILVIFLFLLYHKLPIRQYLDILAVGLMLALACGRIGCFLNGCCFGKPTDLPWAVRFPYGSFAYSTQVRPDYDRNREEPYMNLPESFFSYYTSEDESFKVLKSYNELTAEQKKYLKEQDKFYSLPVHPTQLYSSAAGLSLCLLLYLLWRRTRTVLKERKTSLIAKPGCVFSVMFILYGIARFYIETLRDDNPFEYGWWIIYKGGTISQNLGMYLVIAGVLLLIIFQKSKLPPARTNYSK